MTRLEPAMANKDLGPGEAADRARSRRVLINLSVLIVVGGAVGATTGFLEGADATITSGGTLPGWFAILAAILFVGAVTLGSWSYFRGVDELVRLDNWIASTIGANVFLLSYPVWLILWKGGLVPEPDILTLYLVVVTTTMIAYFWRKWR